MKARCNSFCRRWAARWLALADFSQTVFLPGLRHVESKSGSVCPTGERIKCDRCNVPDCAYAVRKLGNDHLRGPRHREGAVVRNLKIARGHCMPLEPVQKLGRLRMGEVFDSAFGRRRATQVKSRAREIVSYDWSG